MYAVIRSRWICFTFVYLIILSSFVFGFTKLTGVKQNAGFFREKETFCDFFFIDHF